MNFIHCLKKILCTDFQGNVKLIKLHLPFPGAKTIGKKQHFFFGMSCVYWSPHIILLCPVKHNLCMLMDAHISSRICETFYTWEWFKGWLSKAMNRKNLRWNHIIQNEKMVYGDIPNFGCQWGETNSSSEETLPNATATRINCSKPHNHSLTQPHRLKHISWILLRQKAYSNLKNCQLVIPPSEMYTIDWSNTVFQIHSEFLEKTKPGVCLKIIFWLFRNGLLAQTDTHWNSPWYTWHSWGHLLGAAETKTVWIKSGWPLLRPLEFERDWSEARGMFLQSTAFERLRKNTKVFSQVLWSL